MSRQSITRSDSIGARVSSRRKRQRSLFGSDEPQQPSLSRSTSRRRLNTTESLGHGSPRDEQIRIIKDRLRDCAHHGTGNPLVLRSPSTPPDFAVQTLAKIIISGVLGRAPSKQDSFSTFRTERGTAGSFWTNRVKLAGSYGWTGLILPENVDTSQPLQIDENVMWFVVENDAELEQLRSLLQAHPARWKAVEERVVTVAQLAERLKTA